MSRFTVCSDVCMSGLESLKVQVWIESGEWVESGVLGGSMGRVLSLKGVSPDFSLLRCEVWSLWGACLSLVMSLWGASVRILQVCECESGVSGVWVDPSASGVRVWIESASRPLSLWGVSRHLSLWGVSPSQVWSLWDMSKPLSLWGVSRPLSLWGVSLSRVWSH